MLEQWRFHNVKSRRTKPQSEPDKATGDWGTIIYSSINFIESQFMQNPGIKDVASHWLGRTMSPFSLYNLDEALKTDVETPYPPPPQQRLAQWKQNIRKSSPLPAYTLASTVTASQSAMCSQYIGHPVLNIAFSLKRRRCELSGGVVGRGDSSSDNSCVVRVPFAQENAFLSTKRKIRFDSQRDFLVSPRLVTTVNAEKSSFNEFSLHASAVASYAHRPVL